MLLLSLSLRKISSFRRRDDGAVMNAWWHGNLGPALQSCLIRSTMSFRLILENDVHHPLLRAPVFVQCSRHDRRPSRFHGAR